jgi:hypothetical protein
MQGNPMLSRTLPGILLFALALPVRAQNVVVDEGTFRIFDHGRDVGAETFTIRRVGQGTDTHVIANGVIELDLPGGHQQVKPLLRSGSDLSLSAYQVEVSGSDPTEVAVTLSGRRFLTRTRTLSGELEREFRATPGTVVLDNGVAHQYWFLSRLTEGTEVTALIPRAGAQYRIQVREALVESVQVAGAEVQARHVTLAIEDRVHEVWYDAEGRVLKVVVADTGFSAERTSQ